MISDNKFSRCMGDVVVILDYTIACDEDPCE